MYIFLPLIFITLSILVPRVSLSRHWLYIFRVCVLLVLTNISASTCLWPGQVLNLAALYTFLKNATSPLTFSRKHRCCGRREREGGPVRGKSTPLPSAHRSVFLGSLGIYFLRDVAQIFLFHETQHLRFPDLFSVWNRSSAVWQPG